MLSRTAFAYVVGITGPEVTLNLRDEHRGQLAAHADGVSAVTDIGALFGVVAGPRLLVMRVTALRFAEPRDAHARGVGTPNLEEQPLRHVVAIVLGILSRRQGRLRFEPDSLVSPPLGAEALPLSDDELRATREPVGTGGPQLELGSDFRSGSPLLVELSTALGRHVAVIGSTGQGKSCLTAAVLQQIVKLPKPRVVVFDINGEYSDALRPHVSGGEFKLSVLGGTDSTRMRIPYYAFGRHGLGRILLPSEKTQRPAMNFALDMLRFVEWNEASKGAGLVGSGRATMFDDCRGPGADVALASLEALRSGTAPRARSWPHMRALASLVAESHSIRPGKYGPERYAFDYGNVAPLITRIRRCVEDELFTQVVDVEGSGPVVGDLSWRREGARLVSEVFGDEQSPWKIHVLDLRNVAHDLMPLVLGGLLELFAFELFDRGPGRTFPTLLVLEEAHHYLRSLGDADEAGGGSLAYERLAKEGRKFGLGLWLSTQRPSELSSTVLTQCGTWIAFRTIGAPDLKALRAAAEWIDDQDLQRVSGLPRRNALVFGAAVRIPTRVIAAEARPVPRSTDPDFSRWAPSPPTIGLVRPASDAPRGRM